MTSIWLAVGAACCAVSVGAGAFGAHGLAERLDADHLALWETAARYLMYGGLGVALIGLALVSQDSSGYRWAAQLLFVGTVIFSGTVFVLALGGPAWLGAVTPLGGLGMIVGFVVFAWTAYRG